MFDAGRLLAALSPIRTEVAESRRVGHKVHINLIRTGRDHFIHLDTDHAFGEVVLLLTGDLAGMTAGAPIILYQ
jgi:hypothetical protein